MTAIEDAVVAVRSGDLAVIPTDTVYGLVCDPYRLEAVERLAAVKGRTHDQPIALIASSLETLFNCLPELCGRLRMLASDLLPGPYTLVVPNPTRRFRWLARSRTETLGVRVPDVSGAAHRVLEILGAVAGTSANLHGGPDPRRVEDLAPEISSAAVVVDGGELSGTPSTVLDLTGQPAVLREGAVPAAEALARVHRLLGQ
jgi:L-threonylcarbamoyladenylate synthase